jgi:hypothetical protein
MIFCFASLQYFRINFFSDKMYTHRQFHRELNWKQTSIAFRLASRALNEIDEISCARSMNGLKNKYKKMITQTYAGDCRLRNCFICSRISPLVVQKIVSRSQKFGLVGADGQFNLKASLILKYCI